VQSEVAFVPQPFGADCPVEAESEDWFVLSAESELDPESGLSDDFPPAIAAITASSTNPPMPHFKHFILPPDLLDLKPALHRVADRS